MNCEVLQRHLLGSESPDSPSAGARAHLAGCAACREWLQRLLQIESALPCLPVPPAEAARSALVRRILAGESVNGQAGGATPAPQPRRRPSIAMVLGSWIMDAHASPRRRGAAGLVAGVAAALLLFVTAWLLWLADRTPPDEGPAVKAPEDSLAQHLRRYKIEPPGEKATPSERVKVMASAAKQLSDSAAGQRRPDDELIGLAQLYSRVVDEGIVKTAEGLSPEEGRDLVESLCEGLEKAQSEWTGLASHQTGLSPRVTDALQKAADAARDGKKRLRELFTA
jgi:hypothetical protein